MKAWIGSKDLMRDRSSRVLRDRKEASIETSCRTYYWHHSVLAIRGPGDTEGCCDKSRNPVSQPQCSAFPKSSLHRIFYIRFRITPKSIRFQSCFITPGLEGFFCPPSIIKWTLQMIGAALSPHIFSITVPKHSWFDVH